jgi:Flp pilus assembly protein, protease CpaA
MEWFVCVLFLLITCLLIFISWQDILLRIISNKSLIALLFIVIPLMLIQYRVPNIAAALVIILCFFPLFICNVIGGGDVKLMAILALSLTWSQLIDFLLLTSFIGCGIGIIGLVLFRQVTKERGLPYGVAISLAYIAYYSLYY